jgi:predicted porin
MKFLGVFLIVVLPSMVIAQDDMVLLENADSVREYVSATFKGTKIINFQSVETPGKKVLEFMIQHRFGDINGGANSFFGLDNGATIRFGLGYGITDRLEVGIGRTSLEKLVDGYVKYRLMKQTLKKGIPVSITLMGATYVTNVQDPDADLNGFDKYHYFSDRITYSFQTVIARKFSDRLSLQINPIYIHYNLVENITDKNDALAMGLAGRYKFSKRMAVTLEYGLKYNSYTNQTYYNTMGIGWEIETGGHVFQMFVTNSSGIVEPQYMTHTTTSWKDGGVRLGFNISRAFNF